MTQKLVAIVLAAGASRRLGAPKQLVRIDGVPIVARITDAVSACAETAVVVGAVRDVAISGVTILSNEDWNEGIASSIRVGVAWAAQRGADGVLLASCDQYRLTDAHVVELVRAFERHRIVASRYDGVLGVPAIFSREHFEELAALAGDHGARVILRRARDVHAVDWPEGIIDLDTPEDLVAAQHFGLSWSAPCFP